MNGIEPITTKDLVDFYGTLSSVITKLERGVSVFQIEQNMALVDDDIKVEPTKNIWEELRLMKEALKKQNTAIRTLKWRSKKLPNENMDAGAHAEPCNDRSPYFWSLGNPQKSKKTTLYIPIINILPQKADRGLCIYLLGYLVSTG